MEQLKVSIPAYRLKLKRLQKWQLLGDLRSGYCSCTLTLTTISPSNPPFPKANRCTQPSSKRNLPDYNVCVHGREIYRKIPWKLKRRLLNLSVLFFKFQNNLVNCNIPKSVSSHRKLRTTRRHQLSSVTNSYVHANFLSFNYSFFPRSIRLWNLLPYEVVSSGTLSCFKQPSLASIRSLKVPPHLRRL